MSSPDPVPELPEPSAELVLILALVQAHVETLPKRRRDRFLAAVDRVLGVNESTYNVLRFRPRSQDPEVLAAMRHARGWWRQALGVLARE